MEPVFSISLMSAACTGFHPPAGYSAEWPVTNTLFRFLNSSPAEVFSKKGHTMTEALRSSRYLRMPPVMLFLIIQSRRDTSIRPSLNSPFFILKSMPKSLTFS